MNCYSLMTFFLKGHLSKVGSSTNASRQQAVWQYGGATNILSTFLFANRLQFQLTNNAEQLNKQWTFIYKFSFGYGQTNHGFPPHRQAVPLAARRATQATSNIYLQLWRQIYSLTAVWLPCYDNLFCIMSNFNILTCLKAAILQPFSAQPDIGKGDI